MNYEFGHVGGRRYMKTIFEEGEVSAEVAGMYKKIKQSFQSLDCALLPHPGKRITQRRPNAGVPTIDDVDDDFLESCDLVFEEMFSNPAVKKLRAEPLVGIDITNLAYTISNLMETRQFNEHVMYKACVQTHLQKITIQCEEGLFNSIKGKMERKYRSKQEIKQIHSEAVHDAMQNFDSEAKDGNPAEIRRHRDKLFSSLMDRHFMFDCYNNYLQAGVIELYEILLKECAEHVLTKNNGTPLDQKSEATRMFKSKSVQDPLDAEIREKFINRLGNLFDNQTGYEFRTILKKETQNETLIKTQNAVLWQICKEMNQLLSGKSATEQHMRQIQTEGLDQFEQEIKNMDLPVLTHDQKSSFEIALEAQMSSWKKINMFHSEAFPNSTEWDELWRKLKKAITYPFSQWQWKKVIFRRPESWR
uniref:Atlastin-2-like n=1 Tax=Phallusia mammillata TaxID=59560 RepID=A0A6F9D6E0_9ASCI|nr:atlastin-2-like [Phallusia mammillata]